MGPRTPDRKPPASMRDVLERDDQVLGGDVGGRGARDRPRHDQAGLDAGQGRVDERLELPVHARVNARCGRTTSSSVSSSPRPRRWLPSTAQRLPAPGPPRRRSRSPRRGRRGRPGRRRRWPGPPPPGALVTSTLRNASSARIPTSMSRAKPRPNSAVSVSCVSRDRPWVRSSSKARCACQPSRATSAPPCPSRWGRTASPGTPTSSGTVPSMQPVLGRAALRRRTRCRRRRRRGTPRPARRPAATPSQASTFAGSSGTTTGVRGLLAGVHEARDAGRDDLDLGPARRRRRCCAGPRSRPRRSPRRPTRPRPCSRPPRRPAPTSATVSVSPRTVRTALPAELADGLHGVRVRRRADRVALPLRARDVGGRAPGT